MNILKNKWAWLTIVFILFTPLVFRIAETSRGYPARGGEIFFPIIPLVLWLWVSASKDIKNTVKENTGLSNRDLRLDFLAGRYRLRRRYYFGVFSESDRSLSNRINLKIRKSAKIIKCDREGCINGLVNFEGCCFSCEQKSKCSYICLNNPVDCGGSDFPEADNA